MKLEQDLNTQTPTFSHGTVRRIFHDRTDDSFDNHDFLPHSYLQNLLEKKDVQKNSLCLFFLLTLYCICHFQRIHLLGSHEKVGTCLSFSIVSYICVHCIRGSQESGGWLNG